MSYSPYIQVSNLQTAPGSLILHHSYIHSYCSVKFCASSAHSQALKGKSTLAFGWLLAMVSSAVSSFTPDRSLQKHSSEEHAPSWWRENPPVLSSHIQSPRKCKFRIILLTLILSWPHQKENSCQQPHPCFIVLWSGGRAGFWEKKANTSFSSVSQEECEVNHRLFPSKFVVSSLGI